MAGACDGALRVSMIVIGDEILGGFVQDTNSSFVARRLQTLGVPFERVVTVSDELGDIVEALHGELARSRPRVLLTSGGIGSTPDDRTIEAVAATLGVGLRVERSVDARITEAIAWAAERGVRHGETHDRAMRKMALVPEPAYLLPGAQGVAPGLAVDVDGGSDAATGATVVVLPGIPSELQRIVADGIEPALLQGRGVPQHVVELRHGYAESTLNPALDQLVAEFPDVHLGSYPGHTCLIRLKGGHDRVEAAAAVVRKELERLDALAGSEALRQRWQSRWTPDS